MAWYAVFKESKGELVSVGTQIDPGALGAGLAFTHIPHQPNFAVEKWDAATRTLVALPPITDSITIAQNTLNSDTGKMLKRLLEKMGVQVIVQ